MRIADFNQKPISSLPFLNAGRRPNQFYRDQLLVYHGRVSGMPDALDCIVATADLQGREVLSKNPTGPPRLLGEILPELIRPHLESLGVMAPDRILCLLGGDFYTYEDLRGRGGTGDVSKVWRAIADSYGCVAGVAGNHDMFGPERSQPPRFKPPTYFLDGNRANIAGLSVAGISGIIGNPEKNFRRTEADYLDKLELALLDATDIAIMHDGPDAPALSRAKGSPEIREVLERTTPSLVVRGHCHWPQPLTELAGGVQVLNVDCTVAILTR